MTQAGVGTSPGFDAIDVRRMVAAEQGEGVQTYESFRVRQRAAGGPGMFVDIGMDVEAFVRGDAVALQGLYTVAPHSALITEAVPAADPTNPRIDQVVLELKDTTHDASGSNLAQTRVAAGTPTGGATLDNRSGAAALPSSAILLADFLVPALATTVVDANIRDRRPFTVGTPPLLTDLDIARFVVPFETASTFAPSIFHTLHDLQQAAVLFYLPRRIVGATRIRWKYVHGTTALTGNYVIGIYDSSGRKIVDTGSVAFTGALSTYQARSETIAATTFEPGLYYVLIGVDTGAGSASISGFNTALVNSGLPGPSEPNVVVRSATGGVTAPTTLLGFTDAHGLAANTDIPSVPSIALSVG